VGAEPLRRRTPTARTRPAPARASGPRGEQELQEAAKKEQELLTRLRALPDGRAEGPGDDADDRASPTFAGYREYPTYDMVSRYSSTSRMFAAFALANLYLLRKRLRPAGATCLRYHRAREGGRT